MKHTPGPWNVCEPVGWIPQGRHWMAEQMMEMWWVGKRPGVAVALIDGSADGREEAEANARLIAAAPELYEELHTVSDWLATVAGEMDCTAGNFDGGSAASCEHCQWKQSIARIDALLLRAGGAE